MRGDSNGPDWFARVIGVIATVVSVTALALEWFSGNVERFTVSCLDDFADHVTIRSAREQRLVELSWQCDITNSGERTVSVTSIAEKDVGAADLNPHGGVRIEDAQGSETLLPLKIEVGDTKRVFIHLPISTDIRVAHVLARVFPNDASYETHQVKRKLADECVQISAASGPIGGLRYEEMPDAPIETLTLAVVSGENVERTWLFAARIWQVGSAECEEFKRARDA